MGSKWQFQGVDFTKLQFPTDEYLPKNVSLNIMDVFGQIPEEMVEKFDVVHIRTFALVIKSSDPMPLLQNLIRMISRVPPLFIAESIDILCTLMIRIFYRAGRLFAMGGI